MHAARAAVGHGATEAPRGMLYHRYEIDEDGTILDARIVPPTSQNQLAIEEDLRAVVRGRHSTSPDEELTLRCEQAIRNHDPCISCATHFLELTVDALSDAGARVVVIGVGNDLRGDDGAGLEVARRLAQRPNARAIRVAEQPADPTRLLELWSGVDGVVLVDTMRSDQDPGTVCRLDASAEPLPARFQTSSSTHAFGLHEAIELGRTLGRLPPRVIVYAIEGGSVQAGAALSAELQSGLPALAEAVWAEANALAAAQPPG